jgi:hypothetical protein
MEGNVRVVWMKINHSMDENQPFCGRFSTTLGTIFVLCFDASGFVGTSIHFGDGLSAPSGWTSGRVGHIRMF